MPDPVMLFAPSVAPPVPFAALMFVITPADDASAPEMKLSSHMVLEGISNSVAPSADPSFNCISRPALWYRAEHPEWESEPGTGAVLSSCYVARGTVTRSNNG